MEGLTFGKAEDSLLTYTVSASNNPRLVGWHGDRFCVNDPGAKYAPGAAYFRFLYPQQFHAQPGG
jgi:hypothetical protein